MAPRNAVMAQPALVIVTAEAVVASGFGFVMGVAGMIAGFAGAVLGGLDTATPRASPPPSSAACSSPRWPRSSASASA